MTTKLRYGHEVDPPHASDDAWTKLNTVREYLEDQHPLPPYLAKWLGEAIENAHRDPSELMRRLGLKKSRGRPSKSNEAWLTYGERLYELEDEGISPEAAIEKVLTESDTGQGGVASRSQMQKWRNKYRKAREAN